MELGELAAVYAALDALSVSLDHLVKLVEHGGLDGLDDAGLVGFLRGFEQLRNRLLSVAATVNAIPPRQSRRAEPL